MLLKSLLIFLEVAYVNCIKRIYDDDDDDDDDALTLAEQACSTSTRWSGRNLQCKFYLGMPTPTKISSLRGGHQSACPVHFGATRATLSEGQTDRPHYGIFVAIAESLMLAATPRIKLSDGST